jgi:uncharacterized protein YecT (DUF1311 family)
MMLLVLLLFTQAASECEDPSPGDFRPYTLCLAETDLDREEIRLNRQLRITLARVASRHGIAAKRRLRQEQRVWLGARNHKCAAFAVSTPVTQEARYELACRAQLTAKRTHYLNRIAEAR